MTSTRPTAETRDAEESWATALVTAHQTGGRLALVEIREAGGRGVHRHVHANEDEILYVLEGELAVWVGDEAVGAAAGTCVVLPRGVEHSYVVGSAGARLLVVLAPAGLEGYFDEASAALGEVDVERLIAVAARYGVAITGPVPVPRE